MTAQATKSASAEFQENTFFERLLNIRRRDRRMFDGLAPAIRLELVQYEAAKRRAAEVEAMRREQQNTTPARREVQTLKGR